MPKYDADWFSAYNNRMISQENREFVNFLFDKLHTHTDTDMIDLHNSDSCDDHLQFESIETDD